MKIKHLRITTCMLALLLAFSFAIPISVKASNTSGNNKQKADNGGTNTYTAFKEGVYYDGESVSKLDCTKTVTKAQAGGNISYWDGRTVYKCTKGGSADPNECKFEQYKVVKTDNGKASFEKQDTTGAVQATETEFGEGDQLTNIFSTAGFQGSAKALSSASIVGKFMGYLISYVCLAILCFVVFQIMITMLYLSAPVFWNKVDQIQAPTVPTFGNNKAIAAASSGLNTVLTFIIKQVINVKELSDYSKEGVAYYKLDANRPTMSQYFAHRSLQIILVIFFASIGYNGGLLRAYAVVVSGMGQALETVIDTDLAAVVDDLLNSGTNYQFNYSADGTNVGQLTQTAVKGVYANCIASLDRSNRSAAVKSALGASIDSKHGSEIKSAIQSLITDIEGSTNDDDAAKYSVSIVKSYNDSLYGSGGLGKYNKREGAPAGYICYSISDLHREAIIDSGGSSNTKPQYVYVYIYKSASDSAENTFKYTPPPTWIKD